MYIDDLVRYFRSLDAALDEHKGKGTLAGHASYSGMFEQLAEDMADMGVGRDQISVVAEQCGHLSTYKRLEQLMTKQNQPQESAAITHLGAQLDALATVSGLDYRNPNFITWKNTTITLLQRFLQPDSAHLQTFRDLRFRGPVQVRPMPYGYRGPTPGKQTISSADAERFARDCAIAEGCIRAAIEEIRIFGVPGEKAGEPSRQHSRAGVQQTFHGPVTIQNQAIATDNALQSIGQIGNVGSDLREIAMLLNESLDLTGREKIDGLKAIETIAAETKKPEPQRDWKSILDVGEKLIAITSKAADMSAKLAPYLPVVTDLIHRAANALS